MADDIQIIYLLTNPAMPGLVKIGITGQSDVEVRIRQLFTTSVPVPFEINYACKVENAEETERSLHFAFGDHRINPNREFFRIAPERVVAVLKLLQVEEVTSQITHDVDSDTDEEDRQSSERLKRSRRPNLNFTELGIPVGSILKFRDGTAEVKVISDRKVEFDGEETSLTAATVKVLGYEKGYPLQPSPYWSFNGRTIDEIYEEYHGTEEVA